MIDKGQTGRSKKIPVTISTRDRGFFVKFDALMDEEETLEATIPQYVTDKGYEISDNIYTKAKELKMTLMISESPVTWSSLRGEETGEEHVEDILSQLKNLFFKRVPVDIQTSRNNFLNFGIERLVVPKTLENGYSREIEAVFREIRTTSLDTTDIEYDENPEIDTSMSVEGTILVSEITEQIAEFTQYTDEYLRENYDAILAQDIISIRNQYKEGSITKEQYAFVLFDIIRNVLYAETHI